MKKIFLNILFIFLIFMLISCSSSKYTHRNFFELIDDGVEKYQLHRPAEIKDGAKYPVLIYLHALGEHEYTLAYPFYYYFLTARILMDDFISKVNTDPDYYESYVVLSIEENWGPEPESVLRIIERLINEEAADPDRIYIVGVSMGGFAASDFIFNYPDIPACAVLICGNNYYADKAPDILDIPVRLYHSGDDDRVSVDISRTFYNGIIELGGEKTEYFEFTGYRHSAWDYAYRTDLLDWIYLQNKTN